MSTRKSSGIFTTEDICKSGYLKKLKSVKKVKKKFFVLRRENKGFPSKLEYYDSEKKFLNATLPKRSIILKTCFNISRKSDSKFKYGIALYTKEDCFSIVCDSEQEEAEWLSILLNLQNGALEEGQARPLFEHIWQVTLKPRGLCNNKTLVAGLYRLCLTNKSLSLVQISSEDPSVTFELACIRRVGHSDSFFFMEVGRSAVTGSGELWIEVEDPIIAQNIHEAFNSSIKNSSSSDHQPFSFRQRSISSASQSIGSKPITGPLNQGPSPSYDSATLPKRSKTISGDFPSSPQATRLRPTSKSISSRSNISTSYGRGHSPATTSPLSHTLKEEVIRIRTDSIESRGTMSTCSLSADELDLSPLDHYASSSGACSTRSDTPDTGNVDGVYLPMAPSSAGIDVTLTEEEPPKDEYIDMIAAGISSPDAEAYLHMSPSTTIDSLSEKSGFSPAVSSASETHEADSAGGYLEMTAVSHTLPTVTEQDKNNEAGYFDMSPASSTTSGSLTQLRPERMQSYISDEGDEFPQRAYSVGSNPLKTSYKSERGYIDMTINKGNLEKKKNKSSSAPHLSDEVQKSRKGSLNDLFMELDFYTVDRWKESFRPRTGSSGRVESRTSTFGHPQDIRKRASSFGKEGQLAIRRLKGPAFSEPHRPRTATICQDSFRKSSLIASEMRPRSSSHGNQHQRFKRQRNTIQEHPVCRSLHNSSQDSLKRVVTPLRLSQESIKSSLSSDYLDMQGSNPKLSSSPAHSVTRCNHRTSSISSNSSIKQAHDSYLDMDMGGKDQKVSNSLVEEENRNLSSEHFEPSPQKCPKSTLPPFPLISPMPTELSPKIKNQSRKKNSAPHKKLLSEIDSSLKNPGQTSEYISTDSHSAVLSAMAAALPTSDEYMDVTIGSHDLPKKITENQQPSQQIDKASFSSKLQFLQNREYAEIDEPSYSLMDYDDKTPTTSTKRRVSDGLHKIVCQLSLDDSTETATKVKSDTTANPHIKPNTNYKYNTEVGSESLFYSLEFPAKSSRKPIIKSSSEPPVTKSACESDRAQAKKLPMPFEFLHQPIPQKSTDEPQSDDYILTSPVRTKTEQSGSESQSSAKDKPHNPATSVASSSESSCDGKQIQSSNELISQLSANIEEVNRPETQVPSEKLKVELADVSVYENLSFGDAPKRTSFGDSPNGAILGDSSNRANSGDPPDRTSSGGSPERATQSGGPELHYASLDIGACSEETLVTCADRPILRSPLLKSRHSSSNAPTCSSNSNAKGNGNAAAADDSGPPLQYASIDFSKSDAADTDAGQPALSARKETPIPFDFADVPTKEVTNAPPSLDAD